MATQQPAQAFASHLINQTLSSIALLESLSLINSADASLIRQKLPSPTGPFPSLSPPSPSNSFANLTIAQSSPTSSWTVQHARDDSSANSPSNNMQSSAPAPTLPPRQKLGPAERRAKALWDFSGTETDDLQFRSGDTIIIDEEVNDQWSRGRVIPNGHSLPLPRSGLFPSNYVEQLPPVQSNAPPPPQMPYYQSPPPGPQSMVPYQPPQQGYYDQKPPMQVMPPQQQVQGGVVVQQEAPHKHRFGKLGSQLGTAAVTGVGFGAGSAVGSGIINSIF
ncbi:hypothetical protein I312_101327 [Cryptococcus bacillisporus CA1280]|uniref:SH3 domain-containing protein n=1 Tax=Cryptococcus bacillisporus CA1280 TaxID=1296109 RepID=A0A0D0VQD9_CRYGA|nr:hypothetical protein I312_02430 [Cryptococcus bacillisporus CA1280]